MLPLSVPDLGLHVVILYSPLFPDLRVSVGSPQISSRSEYTVYWASCLVPYTLGTTITVSSFFLTMASMTTCFSARGSSALPTSLYTDFSSVDGMVSSMEPSYLPIQAGVKVRG